MESGFRSCEALSLAIKSECYDKAYAYIYIYRPHTMNIEKDPESWLHRPFGTSEVAAWPFGCYEWLHMVGQQHPAEYQGFTKMAFNDTPGFPGPQR